MSDQCEKLRVSYEHARAEVVNCIASPNYTKEKCESLFDRAVEKKNRYIQCLIYSGVRPIPILWVPACPYKEGPPEYLGPEAAEEYGYEPAAAAAAPSCVMTAIGAPLILLGFLRTHVRPRMPTWFVRGYYIVNRYILSIFYQDPNMGAQG